MQKSTYYLTTPIYYLNGKPHIGHAYTTVAADFIARFHRLKGNRVYFLTGTDEYGQKVQAKADELQISPQELVDKNVKKFQDLIKLLACSNNDFIRTTEERHKEFVQNTWKELVASGHIYLGKYSGWYSVRDEAFYQKSEVIDGKAPSGSEVEFIEEESYFFRLSNFQDQLIDLVEANPNFVLPHSRRNEVLSFLRKERLKDLSISRKSVKWGIPVPGNNKHTIYVWLDALCNYISALKKSGKDHKNLYDTFWPCNLHIVGKDILRFHAIYWPAFLMALNIPPPKRIFAHGWWTNQGVKMSKSLGNVVDPTEILQELGTDYLRYYLLRDVTFGNDGTYTKKRVIDRINSELVNSIGNLIHRTLSFAHKNCKSVVPKPSKFTESDNILLQKAYLLVEKATESIENQEISQYLNLIYELSNDVNVYINQEEPWKIKVQDESRMDTIIYSALECIRIIAVLLQPATPNGASKVLEMMSLKNQKQDINHQTPLLECAKEHAIKPGTIIKKPEIVFQKLEEAAKH